MRTGSVYENTSKHILNNLSQILRSELPTGRINAKLSGDKLTGLKSKLEDKIKSCKLLDVSQKVHQQSAAPLKYKADKFQTEEKHTWRKTHLTQKRQSPEAREASERNDTIFASSLDFPYETNDREFCEEPINTEPDSERNGGTLNVFDEYQIGQEVIEVQSEKPPAHGFTYPHFTVNFSLIERQRQEAAVRELERKQARSASPGLFADSIEEDVVIPKMEEFKVDKTKDELLGSNEAEIYESLKIKKLCNSIFSLPVILAPELHLQEDKNFVIGCQYMMKHNFLKAIQCFRQQEQDVSEHLTTSDDEDDHSDCSSSKTKTFSSDKTRDQKVEQDMLSIDSHLKQHQMQWFMFDIEVFRDVSLTNGLLTPSINVEDEASLRSKDFDQPTRSPEFTYLWLRRQMSNFQIGVCFAKCGYLERAIQVMNAVKHLDFQVVVNFNRGVFELLKKQSNNLKALKWLGSSVKELENQPIRPWLITREFKQTLSYCLLFLRERLEKKTIKQSKTQLHQKQMFDKMRHERCQTVQATDPDLVEVDSLLIRLAKVKAVAAPEMTHTAMGELDNIVKYIDRSHHQAAQSRQKAFDNINAMIDVKERIKPDSSRPSESSFYNLVQKVNDAHVYLPFTNAPVSRTGQGRALSVLREVQPTPFQNDTIQRLSARGSSQRSTAELSNERRERKRIIKDIKTKMATRQARAAKQRLKEAEIKLNPFNQVYLGLKDSKRALKLLQLKKNDYSINLQGINGFQAGLSSSDVVNVRNQTQIRKQARIQKELDKIDQMSSEDIENKLMSQGRTGEVLLKTQSLLSHPVGDVQTREYDLQSSERYQIETFDIHSNANTHEFILRPNKHTQSGKLSGQLNGQLDLKLLSTFKLEEVQKQVNTNTRSNQLQSPQEMIEPAFKLKRYDKFNYKVMKDLLQKQDENLTSEEREKFSEFQSALTSLKSSQINSKVFRVTPVDKSQPLSKEVQQTEEPKPESVQAISNSPREPTITQDIEATQEDGIYCKEIQQKNMHDLLEESYIVAQISLFKLGIMLQDPKKFRHKKLTAAYMHVADRISLIRERSYFGKDLQRYSKTTKIPQIRTENQTEIVQSLHNAFDTSIESPFYTEHLRINEVSRILDYKRNQRRGKILDFHEISRSLRKLLWFSSVSVENQQLIINRAQIKVHKAGDILLHQGDTQDTVFVVLRGVVQVSTKRFEWNTEITCILKSIYDGAVFGETGDFENMDDNIQEIAKDYLSTQNYTFTVQEESCIMSIQQSELNLLRQSTLAGTFTERLQFLRSVNLFKGVQMVNLLPIAHNIKQKSFKLGEYLVAAGEVPQGLFIVKKGRVKIGLDQLQVKEIQNLQYTWKRLKPEQMKYKGDLMDPQRTFLCYQRKNKLTTEEKAKEAQETIYQMEYQNAKLNSKTELRKRMRIFAPQLKKVDKDYNLLPPNSNAILQFITFFDLHKGSHFGGRVLLDDLIKPDCKPYFENDPNLNVVGRPIPFKPELEPRLNLAPKITEREKDQRPPTNNYGIEYPPAALSVVADSADVEVLIIDKLQLSMLSDTMQRLLVQRLSESMSMDRPGCQEQLYEIKQSKDKEIRQMEKFVGEVYLQNFYERTGIYQFVER